LIRRLISDTSRSVSLASVHCSDWQLGHGISSSSSSLALLKAWVSAIGIRRFLVMVPSMSPAHLTL
jgi:hypothetical protein